MLLANYGRVAEVQNCYLIGRRRSTCNVNKNIQFHNVA